MKKIQLNNREVEIKTSLNELTISQFEKMLAIYSTTYEFKVDEYISLLEILSPLTRDEIENLEIDVFKLLTDEIIIQSFDGYETNSSISITINGIEYSVKALASDLKYTVKEMFLIQGAIKVNQHSYLPVLASILFKEDGGDLTPDSINKRKEIFSENMTMDILAPYLYNLSKLNVK